MRNTRENELTLEQAILPVVDCGINFRNQRKLLHEMFTSTVSNTPENETENWTARQITPFYLALCQLLENLDDIDQVHSDNIIMCMDNLTKQH